MAFFRNLNHTRVPKSTQFDEMSTSKNFFRWNQLKYPEATATRSKYCTEFSEVEAVSLFSRLTATRFTYCCNVMYCTNIKYTIQFHLSPRITVRLSICRIQFLPLQIATNKKDATVQGADRADGFRRCARSSSNSIENGPYPYESDCHAKRVYCWRIVLRWSVSIFAKQHCVLMFMSCLYSFCLPSVHNM